MSGYTLIVNPGSATCKYAVFRGRKKTASFIFQKEGEKKFSFQKNGEEKKAITKECFENSLQHLKKREKKIFAELDAMAFRIVHGANVFFKPTMVTDQVIKKIQQFNDLAPLHNPPAVKILKQARRLFPKLKKVAVFDTAFHHEIPKANQSYALPKDLVKKDNIRRYGFHGIICSSVVHRMGWRLPKRAIICHLGSGCSVTAVLKGKSVDTSMGYTPLEGLVMGTRAGDIDPGLMIHLGKKLGDERCEKMLNKDSGLKALAGTSDMREILKNVQRKNTDAMFTLELFALKAAKYIAAQAISLGGIDRIVFTGGIGENSPLVREKICHLLEPIGVRIHRQKNIQAKIGQDFHGFFSKVKLSYLHADEESEMNRILHQKIKN